MRRAALLAVMLLPQAVRAGYNEGMAARKRGDLPAARAEFEAMLSADPKSGGALEGLSLVALGEGKAEEALAHLERWQALGDSGYIQSLKARAYARLRRPQDQTQAYVNQGFLDLSDVTPLRRADGRLREREPGVFPRARVYKSLSQEGLETPNPQRIVYEGKSIGSDTRYGLGRGLTAIAGAVVRQEAQRNDSRGFTYYDILEQIYSAGLEGRGASHQWSAQYGQSFLHDIESQGVGRPSFSRFKLFGETEAAGVTARVHAERSPYFLRGSGGSSYFALLREFSAKAELETERLGWSWLGRAALTDYSLRTTLPSASLSATKDFGWASLRPSYSRSYQEFYGAGTDGRLAAMPFERWSVNGRAGEEGKVRAGASFGRTAYRDANRLQEGEAELQAWMPKAPSLSATYRFRVAQYAAAVPGYRSTDERSHWLGPVWRRRWGGGALWTQLTYEHGWLNDEARASYEGNAWLAELEWYRGRALSLLAQGRLANTSVRDESYSASLQGRWSF